MQSVLVATDSDAVFDDVEAALGSAETTVARVRSGAEVRGACIELGPNLVILDLQIGAMGGVATALDLRLEESGGRLYPQKILLLLDRDADTFIARQSKADGWMIKPLDARRLRRAAAAVIAGEAWHEPLELNLAAPQPPAVEVPEDEVDADEVVSADAG